MFNSECKILIKCLYYLHDIASFLLCYESVFIKINKLKLWNHICIFFFEVFLRNL